MICGNEFPYIFLTFPYISLIFAFVIHLWVKMKEKKTIILTVAVFLLTILLFGVIRFYFIQSESQIVADTDFLFTEALSRDYNKRLEANDELYTVSLTNDWPKEAIRIETEKGVKIQTNVDSIRKLSIPDKVRIINETMLLSVAPINPDSLNASFSRLLKERDISVSTGIKYREVDSAVTQYSGEDTTFFAMSYPLTERRMGVFNEIVVQPYVQVPFITVVEKAGVKLFAPFLFWLVVFVIFIVYVIRNKDKKEVSLSEVEQIRQILQVDEEHSCLYAKGKTVALTPSFAQLFAQFLKKDGLNLTKKEVMDCWWENGERIENIDNRISQMIHRARRTIAFIEELQIETVRGKGFRLLLKKRRKH